MAGKGYSYVVVVSALMMKFLGPSLSYVAGVYHVALMEQYEHVEVVAWLGSIFACMFDLTGPVASLVINSYDCRTCVLLSGVLGMLGFGASFFTRDIRLLFISYALVAGLGTGFAQGGCMVSIGYHFPKTSSIVSGLVTCGTGLGVMIHPVLIQHLLSQYGLHGAFLLNGGVMFNLCICAMLLQPSPFETQRKNERLQTGRKRVSCRQIVQHLRENGVQFFTVLTNTSFVMLAFSYLCFSISISTLYLYLPDFFYKSGASLQDSSLVVSVSGTGSMISRILVGFAANDTSIGSAVLYNCLPSLVATLILFLPLFSLSSVRILAFGFLTGLYTGGQFVCLLPLVLDTVDVKMLASGIGIMSFSYGIGTLIGPPIAGLIYVKSGQYFAVFIFSASMMFLTTASGFCSTVLRRSKESRSRPTEATPEAEPLEANMGCCLGTSGASQRCCQLPTRASVPCRPGAECVHSTPLLVIWSYLELRRSCDGPLTADEAAMFKCDIGFLWQHSGVHLCGVNDGLNGKDEMFNLLIDRFTEMEADFPKSTADTDGAYFVQVLCNALWYVTSHETI
ncbi:monocarboxylate transporter 12-like [Haliotis asinina]|uniref:monocarboxylate transporter 12-like n=1 Tax=Haliotis asinina TaxID=109174 RepID=UPI003532363B